MNRIQRRIAKRMLPGKLRKSLEGTSQSAVQSMYNSMNGMLMKKFNLRDISYACYKLECKKCFMDGCTHGCHTSTPVAIIA